MAGVLLSGDIENRVSYHPPTEEKVHQHELVRATIKSALETFSQTLPGGREASTAFTKLEEAMFWANAAIARN